MLVEPSKLIWKHFKIVPGVCSSSVSLASFVRGPFQKCTVVEPEAVALKAASCREKLSLAIYLPPISFQPSIKSIHGDSWSIWDLCCAKLSPFHSQEQKSAKGDLLSYFVAQPRSTLFEFWWPNFSSHTAFSIVPLCQPACAFITSPGVNLQNSLCKRFRS